MTPIEAKLVNEFEVNQNSTFMTEPLKGNLHSLTSLENTALFDIIFPNYNWVDRRCDYYKEVS